MLLRHPSTGPLSLQHAPGRSVLLASNSLWHYWVTTACSVDADEGTLVCTPADGRVIAKPVSDVAPPPPPPLPPPPPRVSCAAIGFGVASVVALLLAVALGALLGHSAYVGQGGLLLPPHDPGRLGLLLPCLCLPWVLGMLFRGGGSRASSNLMPPSTPPPQAKPAHRPGLGPATLAHQQTTASHT